MKIIRKTRGKAPKPPRDNSKRTFWDKADPWKKKVEDKKLPQNGQ
jgi:hypothetical protein